MGALMHGMGWTPAANVCIHREFQIGRNLVRNDSLKAAFNARWWQGFFGGGPEYEY